MMAIGPMSAFSLVIQGMGGGMSETQLYRKRQRITSPKWRSPFGMIGFLGI